MRKLCAVIVAILAWTCCPAAAAAVDVTVGEPRAYGHVIGDLVVREVRLTLPAGLALDADALPKPGRVDNWLELHALQVGSAGAAVVLRLSYQVVNVAPDAVTTTTLPALRLALAGGNNETVDVPDWPLHLSPLTPPFEVERGGLDALQPDIVPQREALAPTLWRLTGYLLLASLLAAPVLLARHPQLAFWRRRAPFLAAWRDLRRLRERERAQDDADVQRRALARLHAAFDETARCAVFSQQLEPLYLARPSLRAARADIDAFFATSRHAFFAQGVLDAPPWSLDQALALALKLARLEAAPR